MSRAEVVFEYPDERTAERVAHLLELDNKVAPRELEVRTSANGKEVTTVVEHQNFNTVFATIDDLIFSEKLITSLMED